MTMTPHSSQAGSAVLRPDEPDPPRTRGLTGFGHVVVCVDGSPLGDCALPHALALATAFSAKVTLLHVLEPERRHEDSGPVDALAWEVRRSEAGRYLREGVHKLETGSLETGTALVEGQAPEQILEWVASHDVDLTVLCSHGASGPTQWSLASTAKKIVEGVSGSLLLVPARPESARRAALPYRRILIPLDASPRAECVIPAATRIALAQDAEVVLAHVIPGPGLTRIGPLEPEDVELEHKVIERNRRVAEGYLSALRARLAALGLRVRVVIAGPGETRDELARVIETTRADLVALSAHGLTGRIELPLGKVASHLVEHCEVPLLILREPQGSALGERKPARRLQTTGRLSDLARV